MHHGELVNQFSAWAWRQEAQIWAVSMVFMKTPTMAHTPEVTSLNALSSELGRDARNQLS